MKKAFMFAMYLILSANIYAGVMSLWSTKTFDKVFLVTSAIVSVMFFFERDVFLPFLGEAALPHTVLATHRIPAGANRTVRMQVAPRTRVLYWASEPSDEKVVDSPQKAYKKYLNAGVAMSDGDGHVLLRVRYPSAYKTPIGTIKPHIHYRTVTDDGMLSRIHTRYLPPVQDIIGQ